MPTGLRSGLAQLETNVRELQESVMRVRMLPVGSVFSRFPRLVRDLSARLGKQIRLQLSGEQTELDKTVLEKIGDPLVHLVRNSIDHGIEMPADRLAAGKPEEGLVHLNAFHKGGSINNRHQRRRPWPGQQEADRKGAQQGPDRRRCRAHRRTGV